MTLYEKIMAIYPQLKDADFGVRQPITLQNDGDGDYIAKWEHPDYPMPTQEQLDEVSL